MTHIRIRSQDVDRHNIPKPFMKLKHGEQGLLLDNIKSLRIFTNALLKTRIPDLFKTQAGLAGHVTQLQQEINRLKNIEDLDGSAVDEIIHTEKIIKKALKKSAGAASFPLPWQYKYSI